jgi:hypothetical protein
MRTQSRGVGHVGGDVVPPVMQGPVLGLESGVRSEQATVFRLQRVHPTTIGPRRRPGQV